MAMQIFGDKRVHVSTVGDNGVIVVEQKSKATVGTPIHTGRFAFVRNTYPARYNHAVRNMNSLIAQTTEKKKRSMRGGHFLLYRYIILFALLLCFAFGIASLYVKACATVPFILSAVYIFISIYNIVIFILNHPLIHPYLAIYLHPSQMPESDRQNMFYTVPIHTDVRTAAVGALIDPARIIAAVQLENKETTEIDIMLYTDEYLPKLRFPKEIIIHLILFFIMFILAIIFVASSVSR